MRISIGSDHRGVHVKQRLLALLHARADEVHDVGTQSDQSVDYPDIAAQVAHEVSQGQAERGILICGSGIGMAISANKFAHVRAATCHDERTAELSRRHNDLNVLCLGADTLPEGTSIDRIVEVWLQTEFDGGRHARRVQKIDAIERQAGRC